MGPPALQHGRHLVLQELEEVLRIGEPVAGRRVRAEQLDALPGGDRPLGQHLVPADGNLIPEVVEQQVHVTPAAGLALAADHPQLGQVTDGTGDGCRAGAQQPGQLGGGQPAGVGDQHGGEHPGGHRRHARLHQDSGESLDKGPDGLLAAFGWLLRHRPRAFLPGGSRRFVRNIHDFLNLV